MRIYFLWLPLYISIATVTGVQSLTLIWFLHHFPILFPFLQWFIVWLIPCTCVSFLLISLPVYLLPGICLLSCQLFSLCRGCSVCVFLIFLVSLSVFVILIFFLSENKLPSSLLQPLLTATLYLTFMTIFLVIVTVYLWQWLYISENDFICLFILPGDVCQTSPTIWSAWTQSNTSSKTLLNAKASVLRIKAS